MEINDDKLDRAGRITIRDDLKGHNLIHDAQTWLFDRQILSYDALMQIINSTDNVIDMCDT